ncbi:hypothetical protein [Lactimicrobium massiliense]|uniref:hypothetical protein n=1 Tax=Lactimicrobium massiliense TaxID=2161814 RepID=UPI000D54FC39|nr:hypothetical protein [Lactimicrobium massiliense]
MKKLKSRRGESVTEALAAVLIAALAGLMAAGAVGAANRTMTRSDAKMKAYYEQMNALAEGGESTSASASITANNSGASLTAYSDNIPVTVYSNTTDDAIISVYSK